MEKTAKTPKSKIEKGKRFEKYISREIELAGFGLARREDGSGSGSKKGDVASNLPFLIEAKNQEKLSWWSSIDQAKEQAEVGNWDSEKWALIVKDPGSPERCPEVYAVIDFWQFLSLLRKDKKPKIKKPDRELRWKLETLKKWTNQVLKELKK